MPSIRLLTLLLLLLPCATGLGVRAASATPVLLYDQDFENPNPGSFVNDGDDVNLTNFVNVLYGGQPAGFFFDQANSVETLLVGGNQAWGGTGFQDPQSLAGQYVLGMLEAVNDDQLALAFNVSGYDYLNFKLDISSIDLSNFGGPFSPPSGVTPVFEISLYDNPSGLVGLGSGTALSSAIISGSPSQASNVFDWTTHVVALDASLATNGNVILQIDLIGGNYAALDNFLIAASDIEGELPGVPEPSTFGLAAGGLGVLVALRRLKRCPGSR